MGERESRSEGSHFSCPIELLLCGHLFPSIKYSTLHCKDLEAEGQQQGCLLSIGYACEVILKFLLHCESLSNYVLPSAQIFVVLKQNMLQLKENLRGSSKAVKYCKGINNCEDFSTSHKTGT